MDIHEARREFKFRLSAECADAVVAEVAGVMSPDAGGRGGAYPIVSEYYDSAERDAYWERDRKVGNRRKLRVRVYGFPDGEVPPAAFLEVKHKRDGVGVQRQMELPLEAVAVPGFDLGRLIEELKPERPDKLEQFLMQEVLLLLPSVEPVVQMRYDRLAFEGDDGVRVTFDSLVMCRAERLELQPDDQRFEHVILPPGERIMEVRMQDVAPYWMRDLLATHGLNKTSISKYCDAVELCDPVVAPLVARMGQPIR